MGVRQLGGGRRAGGWAGQLEEEGSSTLPACQAGEPAQEGCLGFCQTWDQEQVLPCAM